MAKGERKIVDYLVLSIIVGVIILLILGILFLRSYMKKKKAMRTEIPEEVLKDLNECERRLMESRGDKNPYEIMWELHKEQAHERSIQNRLTQANKGGQYGSATIEETARELIKQAGRGEQQTERSFSNLRDTEPIEQPEPIQPISPRSITNNIREINNAATRPPKVERRNKPARFNPI